VPPPLPGVVTWKVPPLLSVRLRILVRPLERAGVPTPRPLARMSWARAASGPGSSGPAKRIAAAKPSSRRVLLDYRQEPGMQAGGAARDWWSSKMLVRILAIASSRVSI
jgi:hypothetical protein